MDVTQGKLAMGFRTGGVTCWEEEYPGPAWSRTSQSGQIRPSFTGRADSASFRARATRSSSAEPQ